jgi:hypothetical protein
MSRSGVHSCFFFGFGWEPSLDSCLLDATKERMWFGGGGEYHSTLAALEQII